MMHAVLNILIWSFCGTALALIAILIGAYRNEPFIRRFLMRMTVRTIFVLLIGTARLENITDALSIRGIVGIIAMSIGVWDLVWELGLYLKRQKAR